MGKFTHLNDKSARKVTVPRESVEGRFPRGGSRDIVVPLRKEGFYRRVESLL